ncbi:hypothetical protein CR513_10509, partial [Mucuna pruriens]
MDNYIEAQIKTKEKPKIEVYSYFAPPLFPTYCSHFQHRPSYFSPLPLLLRTLPMPYSPQPKIEKANTSKMHTTNLKPNSESWFTLDDLPPSKWRKRLIEFGSLLDTKFMKVIEEFCCVMTCTLKEWYHNLGAIRQDQFIRLCLLNGLNDHSLKNTYDIHSILNQMAMNSQKDLTTLTLGQIRQMTLEAVEKLYMQHQYFYDIMNKKSKYIRACKKPNLEIKNHKCKNKHCTCTLKKKTKESHSFKRKNKKFKFFKKKKERRRKGNHRCFIYGKKGHFSKN